MAHPVARDSAPEDGGDMVLHQEIREALGTIPAGKSDGHEAVAVSGKQKKCLRHPEATPDIA